MIGDTIVNHQMYADDLLIFSPCIAGLKQLLRVRSRYVLEFED